MTKPTMFVNSVTQQDNEVKDGTLMEFNEPPALLVVVTKVKADLEGSFEGVQLDNGFYFTDWDYDKFHIFRGEVTLSQGY